jgi:2-amino-4-hydroxy-6-hydroxymethyldihydropteridine diphosphokinase
VPPVAIALGSNRGDRVAHLTFAAERLRKLLSDFRLSTLHETEPVGVAAQPRFLNAVAIGTTSLSAGELLQQLLSFEAERGRERPYEGAPRTLDLDMILYGDEVIDEPGLRVPHPRFRDRLFVLEPLAEIAPDWIDPITGATIEALAQARRTQT